jgi:CRISPR-associated protein Cas2
VIFLVCYDIADDRRRERVANELLDYGTRVQESVFECMLETRLAEETVSRLRRTIEEVSDKVLVFTICENCCRRVVALGIAGRAEESEFYIV